MAFFLIGRGPDDDIRLLSSKQFESRQAAMAELSVLSSDPSFEHWDAEVSVMDLSTGTPVLLVRPAAAESEPEAVAVPEPSTAVELDALEPALVPVELVDVAEPLAETPEPAFDAIETPSWEPPAMALIEPVADTAIADEIAAEAPEAQPEAVAEPAPDVEAFAYSEPSDVSAFEPSEQGVVDIVAEAEEVAIEPEAVAEPIATEAEPAQAAVVPEPESAPQAVAPMSEVDDNDELRAAILRTTEHMAAQGIVPPESIGPAPAVEEPVAAQPETPIEDLPATELPAEASPAAADALSAVEESEAAQEPLAEGLPASDSSAPARSMTGFWPWNKSAQAEADSEVAPEVANVYQALEQPGQELPDVEAALSSPLIGGGAAIDTSEGAAAHAPMSSYAQDSAAMAPSDDGASSAGAVLTDAEPTEESDFILDLDSVEQPTDHVDDVELAPVAAPASEAPPAATTVIPAETAAEPQPAAKRVVLTEAAPSAQAVSPLEDFTCADCVYVDTCPNRDQRLPKDCGSFQWR